MAPPAALYSRIATSYAIIGNKGSKAGGKAGAVPVLCRCCEQHRHRLARHIATICRHQIYGDCHLTSADTKYKGC